MIFEIIQNHSFKKWIGPKKCKVVENNLKKYLDDHLKFLKFFQSTFSQFSRFRGESEAVIKVIVECRFD